jgi:hypothetical protein
VNQGDGPHCKAVFSLQNSAVCGLQFANHGGKLAVGYEHGQVRSSINTFPFGKKKCLFVIFELLNGNWN